MEIMEVILYVRDMRQQVVFYRDTLGLAIAYPADLADYGNEFWVTFNTGACVLALHAGGQQRLGADTPKVVFRVSDIQAARAELVQRGLRIGEVRSPASNTYVCDFSDPEGNPLSLESHG